MSIVQAAADHIDIERRARRLQLAHALLARRAVSPDENGQATRTAAASAQCLCTGQIDTLLAGI
jgi:hypothetical protein